MADKEWQHSDAYDHRHVFRSILQQDDLDIREMKSAIVDFISAGIETVSFLEEFCIK